jgi:hypothetical protein
MWPTADPSTLEINADVIASSGQTAIINLAESGVQTWQVANSAGFMDNIITLLLIVCIVISIYSIIKHVRTI